MSALDSVVSAYFEFAETGRGISMYMSDGIEILDGFLKLSKHEIFTDSRKISSEAVELKTKNKYKFLHLKDVSKAEKDYIKALEDMEI